MHCMLQTIGFVIIPEQTILGKTKAASWDNYSVHFVVMLFIQLVSFYFCKVNLSSQSRKNVYFSLN